MLEIAVRMYFFASEPVGEAVFYGMDIKNKNTGKQDNRIAYFWSLQWAPLVLATKN